MNLLKIKELRELSNKELEGKIRESKKELFNLRMKQSTGTLEKPSKIRELRENYMWIFQIENRKQELVWKVVSNKNDKTITVLVETYKTHPLYKKRVKYSKKYTAHDEKNEAGMGDTVRIRATRPLSKSKRYELVEIVTKAVIL